MKAKSLKELEHVRDKYGSLYRKFRDMNTTKFFHDFANPHEAKKLKGDVLHFTEDEELTKNIMNLGSESARVINKGANVESTATQYKTKIIWLLSERLKIINEQVQNVKKHPGIAVATKIRSRADLLISNQAAEAQELSNEIDRLNEEKLRLDQELRDMSAGILKPVFDVAPISGELRRTKEPSLINSIGKKLEDVFGLGRARISKKRLSDEVIPNLEKQLALNAQMREKIIKLERIKANLRETLKTSEEYEKKETAEAFRGVKLKPA